MSPTSSKIRLILKTPIEWLDYWFCGWKSQIVVFWGFVTKKHEKKSASCIQMKLINIIIVYYYYFFGIIMLIMPKCSNINMHCCKICSFNVIISWTYVSNLPLPQHVSHLPQSGGVSGTVETLHNWPRPSVLNWSIAPKLTPYIVLGLYLNYKNKSPIFIHLHEFYIQLYP